MGDPMTGLSAFAAALKHSFDTGDRGRWEALMAPGCVNWHNTDKKEVPSLELQGAGSLRDFVDDLTTEIVQDVGFPGGHLIRMVITGDVPSTGRTLDAHNCIVLQLGPDGIVRIDDYVDPSFGDAFRPLDPTG
jgi:hypothetical protein